MKIVKLNKTHKSYILESGFTHALRFSSYYDKHLSKVRRILHNRYGFAGLNNQWDARLGKRSTRDRPPPYWIYIKNESDISLIMLLLTDD